MKHRIFNTVDSYGDDVELIFINVGAMSLGNNFSLNNFFDELSVDVIEYIYNLEHNGVDTIWRLKGNGLYGNVQATLCDFDLWCYMRDL